MRIIFFLLLFFFLTTSLYPADSTIVNLDGVVDENGNTSLIYVINQEGYYNTWGGYRTSRHVIHIFDIKSNFDTIAHSDSYYWNHGPTESLFTDYCIFDNGCKKLLIVGDINGLDIFGCEAFLKYDNNNTCFTLSNDIFLSASDMTINFIEISPQNPTTIFITFAEQPYFSETISKNIRGYISSTNSGNSWNPYTVTERWYDKILDFIPFYLVSLNPTNEQIMLGLDTTGCLIKTWDAGFTSQIVDTNKIWDSLHVDFYYDKNPQHVYGLSNKENTYYFLHSSDSGNANSWELILSSENEINVTIDTSDSGEVYYSHENKVYRSANNANTFNEFLELGQFITGLYKKPNSNILYLSSSRRIYEYDGNDLNVIKDFDDTTTVRVKEDEVLPSTFALSQNYPNPFNPVTTIKFTIPNVGRSATSPYSTTLIVYDILGNEIATLVNETKLPGTYNVEFDGAQLPSGVYFYRLNAGNHSLTKKMVLMR